jgi:O-antigen ligase
VAAVVIGLLSRFAFDAAGVVQLTADVRAAAIGSRTIYGTILAATVMLIVGLALYSRSKWVSACWIALIPIAIVELLATQTRGAVGGLAAVTAFILVRDYRARSAVAAAVLGLTFLLSGVVWTTPDGRTLALNWSVIVSDPNWLIRVARNQQAVDYVLAHPFTGLGMGHASSSGDAAIAQWVYNPYLAWGVSFGIPALLAFAGLMVVTAIDSFSAVFRTLDRERFLRIGVLAALGAWVVNQFTTGDSLLYLQASEAVFFFWGVVGMVLGCKWVDTASRPPSSKTRGWRVSRDEKAPQERVGVA